MNPKVFEKFAKVYEISSIPELLNTCPAKWSNWDINGDFNGQAPLIVLPYRQGSDILSTGSTMYVSEDGHRSAIRMKILDGILEIDSNVSSSFCVIRVSPNGKWEYIANSTPHLEPAIPGMIYAIRFDSDYIRSSLEKLIGRIEIKPNNLELIANTLEDFGFSVFAIFPSNRKSE